MGLIKAAIGATSSVIGDQFKEFITCPEVSSDVVVQRGIVNHGNANSNYQEGIISNGSKIAVPEGMAMMIVDNGAIKEFTAEAGEFIYDSSSEPSIFTGSLGTGIVDSIKKVGSRISFGGATARDQRVYYINIKNINGNTFGSRQPARISTEKYGIIDVTFHGDYSVKVVDPVNLIKNVIGSNSKSTITYEEVSNGQMKLGFTSRFAQSIAVVMRKYGVPFGDILMYDQAICEEMKTSLDNEWREEYGMEVVGVKTGGVNTTDESLERIHRIDDAQIFSNANMQSGLMAQATAEAMTKAASNTNGAAMGFFGMNMAQQSGANAMGTIYQNTNNQMNNGMGSNMNNQGMNNQNVNVYQYPDPSEIFNKKEEVTPVAPSEVKPESVTPEVTNPFGNANNVDNGMNNVSNAPVENTMGPAPKFCINCGTPVTGKFCSNCGHPTV